MREVFDDSDFELALLETGYRKPLATLNLSDKVGIQKTLKMHTIVRVKPEMDQFLEGLAVCGILEGVQRFSALMAPCFTFAPVDLTAGMCYSWTCDE